MAEVTQEFIEQVSEALKVLGDALENEEGKPRGAEVIKNKAEITNTLSLPGVLYNDDPAENENARALAYVQIPWSVLSRVLADMENATTQATAAISGVDEAVEAAEAAAEAADAAAASANDWNDHPPFIGNGTTGDMNYWYIYNANTKQYVRSAYAKGDNLEWDDITPAEKQMLIQEMLQVLEEDGLDATPTQGSTRPVMSKGIYDALTLKQDLLTFASVATCQEIVEELT
jgi:hypothetical protein